MSFLKIQNLHVWVGGKEIIKGVTLTINSGEVHALMGPNGSGKSTLAYGLMGKPGYEEQKAKSKKQKAAVTLNGKNLLKLPPDERARLGLFLAFQNPLVIQGVSAANFLRTAFKNLYGDKKKLTVSGFEERLKGSAKTLELDESFLSRGLNDGFSGGEKKKAEMLQILTLEPKFIIFDEIDTGLDVDALKLVARGIQRLKNQGAGILLITHHQRILNHLNPDYVHILIDGRIAASGGPELAKKIEKKGYRGVKEEAVNSQNFF